MALRVCGKSADFVVDRWFLRLRGGLVGEDRADADGGQDPIFLGVHELEGGIIVVVKAEAVQRAMEDIEEEFALDGKGAGRGLAAGLIHTSQNVHIEGFALSGRVLGEVEGQDVGGTWDFGELQMGGGHFGVGDETDADFTAAAKRGNGGVGFGPERCKPGGSEERTGIGDVNGQSGGGMASRRRGRRAQNGSMF